MKNTTMRKLAGIAAIVTLASCMMAPMGMTAFAATTGSITITGVSTAVAHTFEAYQVFDGDLAEDGTTLTNLVWGSAVTAYNGEAVTAGEAVPDEVLAILTDSTKTEAERARAFADAVTLSTATKTFTSSNGTATASGLDDGYYIVKDVTNLSTADDANSAWIVQVVDDAEIAIKNAKPTVDKQVQDEVADKEEGADAEGWGESADHAINEIFQFKLTAQITADDDLAFYNSYKVVFHDTLSTGVVYNGNMVVTVNGTEITAGTDYTTDAQVGATATEFTVTINDLIPLLADGDTLGNDTIVVTYDAYLNSDAQVDNGNVESTTNQNDVYLEYSNNPDSTGAGDGTGQTPTDSVWVFTYRVNNTKYANEKVAGNELDGAGFTLKDANGNAIKLIDNEDGTYTVADQTATEGVVTEMISSNDGQFDIIGLDAGTYTLEETTVPDTYNKLSPQTIVINATHAENDAETEATMTLANTSTMNNDIINKSGSSLPSTGGIGTTLFYVIGGTMAAGAGVYLISKKRMNKED